MRSFVTEIQIKAEELWRMSLANMLDELSLLESQLKRVTNYLDDYLEITCRWQIIDGYE